MVGLGGLEPPTSPLSGVRSNRLSYRPTRYPLDQAMCVSAHTAGCPTHSRKEVIQPQVPLRLPCYDFTPVMNHTVDSNPLSVSPLSSGTTHSHGVTGGVYK